MSGSRKPAARHNQVRIIGGQWRGRKLHFTPADGLRPTGDRIRETLFNWLAPYINGARCADLFAGSGALGLEALSRGAGHCDFVDLSKAAIAQVEHHLITLQASDRATCHVRSAQQFLQQATHSYDIVFIDPPFSQHLAEPTCAALAQSQRLHQNALIYVETDAARPQLHHPPGWTLHREKRSGDVHYAVFSNEHAEATLQ
jgi:16S rRNA (guanine966-N2)-methyltransferase